MAKHPSPFVVGQRVRLLNTIERFPLGIWNAGETGTVTEVRADGPDLIGMVRLDRQCSELDEWGNALQVFAHDPDDGMDERGWADWEAV